MADNIALIRHGFVLEIRFDRPDKKNAITAAMYWAMADALGAAERDEGVRVVLFTGAGDSFTAGNDLNDFIATPPVSADAPVVRFLRALAEAEKILVVAVHGAAIGIGTTMLLHCDLVLAAPSARFQLPFVNLGLVPEAASSLLLPRLVGYHRAAELLMLGEAFDAEAAASYGLVTRVVDEAVLHDQALALAARLAAKAPAALRLTKRLLKSPDISIEARMDEELTVFQDRLKSPELREAVRAFFEKRTPDFSRS